MKEYDIGRERKRKEERGRHRKKEEEGGNLRKRDKREKDSGRR